MQVVIDALPVRGGGGATYVRAQLGALATTSPDIEMRTFISPWSSLDALPGAVRRVRLWSVAHRYAYEAACLAWQRADLMYCPVNFAPPVCRSPVVVALHNPNYYLAARSLPETRPSRPRHKLLAHRAALRRAAAIVAISQSLADDVRAAMPEVASRLYVIASGAPQWPTVSRPVPELPEAFMVAVVSSAPHKRLEDIVAGWARARGKSAGVPALVVVGGTSIAQQQRCRAISATESSALTFTGQLADRGQLRWVFEQAQAAISMSALEAFPLIPAEAGSMGCPLVLSDIPPHREVTLGDAAFVRVGDIDGLAATLAAGDWVAGSRPWGWPVSWLDNARQLRQVFDEVVR